MTTLVDKAILSGADNRPPMLEKDMYDFWKSKMELYMINRQHGRMIESIENGPLIWPTIEENGVTRPRKYSKLSPTNAIQADYDVKETNIILQGLPPEERECKLYDEFNKFAYNKGKHYLRNSLNARKQATINDERVTLQPIQESQIYFASVASLFFWQLELSSLAVGTSSASGNSITGSRNALCILFLTILS
nr:hypothetical protein [Tanacetum cinerariifolium]